MAKENPADDPFELALQLQSMLTTYSTGGTVESPPSYEALRRRFYDDPTTKSLLPDFVRQSRDLGAFWHWIKDKAPSYQERRILIRNAFLALLDALEEKRAAPADGTIAEILERFDEDSVHRAWSKALDRRDSDPEGAITTARALLETVCKRILEANDIAYQNDEPLPALYHKAATGLNLAPSQHTEVAFKAILGGCQAVVNNLGELRNKIGDAHGQGGKPVRPAPRHATLAVNLAGAVATFLVETHFARSNPTTD